jgi:hypothetical protein
MVTIINFLDLRRERRIALSRVTGFRNGFLRPWSYSTNGRPRSFGYRPPDDLLMVGLERVRRR